MPTVELEGLNMHYMEKGQGRHAIVFVHGFLASWRWWQKVMDLLPSQYHAYAIDQRGYGETDKPPLGYSIADLAQDVYKFVSKLGLRDFVLVGHSMGGGVTMQFALEHQDLLRAVVMVNSMGADGLDLSSPEVRGMFQSIRGNREGMLELQRSTAARPMDESFVQKLVDDAMIVGDAAFHQGPMAIGSLRIGGRIDQIQVPALVTWGDKDGWIPLDDALKMYRTIPGCSLQIFHRVGHNPHAEIPAEFTQVLVDFIETAAAR